ncbi:MAG: hypothetical protein C4308_14225 [Chitinophagaceae bacterium]
MDCLINYIGLKKNGNDEPESGLYINSLAGVTTELLDKISEEEEEDAIGTWEDIQKIASKRIYADLIAKMRAKYRINTNRGNYFFMPIEGNAMSLTGKCGLLLTFDYGYYTMQSFFVGTVFLIAKNEGTTTLYIIDEQGYVLSQKEVAFGNGLNSFVIGQSFIAKRLFIGFDMKGVNAVYSVNNKREDFVAAIRSVCADSYPVIEGARFDGDYETNVENTFGVGLTGYVYCDHAAFVCWNKQLFAAAWLFLLGNQITIQALASSRLNFFTTIDRPTLEALRDNYQIEYEKILQTVVDGMGLDERDCCIFCNNNPNRVSWLP